jgi:catechol 2,3-dioxygenase-like lactoylglutathione lyase family enzyme
MSFEQIHHTKIFVSNIERSIHFYRDLLHFELVYEAERENVESYDIAMGMKGIHVKVAMLLMGENKDAIGLIQFVKPAKENIGPSIGAPGYSTFAVDVKDIDREYARLREAGVSSISDPTDIIRDDGRRTARCCYVIDPDGLTVELYESFATLDTSK